MTRKILVDSTDLIDSWSDKVNIMSGYIEDLDDLDATFQPGNTWAVGYPNVDRDSSVISSINYIADYTNQIFNSLVSGTAIAQQQYTVKIYADSAVFDKITVNQLWNYDSAMTLGDSDATWFGDSQGTAKFDFNVDSAKFGGLNIVRLREVPDSATFGRLTITDSGFISKLHTIDSTAEIKFGTLKYLGNSAALIDSALVLNVIKVREFISDSGGDSGVNIDTARITNLYIDSNITFADSPSLGLDVLRQLLIADSTGTVQYGGFLLADS